MSNGPFTPAQGKGVQTTPVDRHVGRRIRGKRRALGLSETDLANALNVGVEAIRAYERGAERVPSEQLVRLSEVMQVPLSYFFPAILCAEP
jgi:transcriptional regulator with XRE-family HTH domain